LKKTPLESNIKIIRKEPGWMYPEVTDLSLDEQDQRGPNLREAKKIKSMKATKKQTSFSKGMMKKLNLRGESKTSDFNIKSSGRSSLRKGNKQPVTNMAFNSNRMKSGSFRSTNTSHLAMYANLGQKTDNFGKHKKPKKEVAFHRRNSRTVTEKPQITDLNVMNKSPSKKSETIETIEAREGRNISQLPALVSDH
jgi:hypothetical protein